MSKTSDHFNGRIFLNPVPTKAMEKGAFFRVLGKYLQKHTGREPRQPLGPFNANSTIINSLAPDALRITWLGHSTTLIEIDGKRFLTDPVWYQRASPFRYFGPKRFFANPIAIDDLPVIDYILLSHDHYDHLDKASIQFLVSERKIPVITMLGVKERLIGWGIAKQRVTALDWWESLSLPNNFTITAAPARHFSGRGLNDRFTTLWGSFALRGFKHNVYYGADSGYYDGFKTLGQRLGPFDLTMLENGAYNEEWATIHLGPEGAIRAHLDMGSRLLFPLHWGTFSLAFHGWKEPIERLIKEAGDKDVQLLIPAPGETYDVGNGEYSSKWWEEYN